MEKKKHDKKEDDDDLPAVAIVFIVSTSMFQLSIDLSIVLPIELSVVLVNLNRNIFRKRNTVRNVRLWNRKCTVVSFVHYFFVASLDSLLKRI